MGAPAEDILWKFCDNSSSYINWVKLVCSNQVLDHCSVFSWRTNFFILSYLHQVSVRLKYCQFFCVKSQTLHNISSTQYCRLSAVCDNGWENWRG